MIILYDVETSPLETLTWGKFQQDVLHVNRYSELLSVAWKEYGPKPVHGLTRRDYKKVDGDRGLCLALKDVIEEADMVVGHNLVRFDAPVLQTRLIKHRLGGLQDVATVDTLKIARKFFKFPGNRLDELGEFLGVGRKKKTGGKDLWIRCMKSDPAAFKEMLEYNKQDVLLLEKIFKEISSYARNLPNLANLLKTGGLGNPRCGNPTCLSADTHKHGRKATGKGVQQRYQCQACGYVFTQKMGVKKNV